MQKKNVERLMKERSARASLAAGFRFFMENLRRIFKSTWLSAVITATVCGVAATVIFISWPELMVRIYSDLDHAWQYAADYRMMLITVAALTLLSLACTLWFYYMGLRAFRQLTDQKAGSIKALLPTLHPRYWGRWLLVGFVCSLILIPLLLITSLPEFIIYEANWQAHAGVVGGDPLGMPSSITALTFVTCTLTSFLQLYLLLPAFACLYYNYGGIRTYINKKQ